jgi:hypothetical protein
VPIFYTALDAERSSEDSTFLLKRKIPSGRPDGILEEEQ